MSRDWESEWRAAQEELAIAEEQLLAAETALDAATSRTRNAQRVCAALFRERMTSDLQKIT